MSRSIPWRESLAFRQFHLGFLAYRIGEWHFIVALNWAVLIRTESAIALGVVNACRLIPALLMSLPSGFLADRFQRQRLLFVVYGGMAIATGLVGLLVTHDAPLPLIAVAVFLRELGTTTEPPIRNAFLSDLERRNLARALAVNAMVVNYGRLLGPGMAGFLMVQIGTWAAFAVATLGLAVCALLTGFLRGVSELPRTSQPSTSELKEALDYLRSNRRLRLLFLLMIGPMLLAFPYLPMLPLFARGVLGVEADGLGGLLSLTAAGSMLASMVVVGESRRTLNGIFQIGTLLGFSVSLIALVYSPNYLLAGVSVFLAGACSQAYRTVSRILMQSGVPRNLHGRVVSIALMDRGLIPVGTLLVGWWSQKFGTHSAGLLMGFGSAGVTILLVLMFPEVLKVGPKPERGIPLEQLASPKNVLPPGPA